MGTRVSGYRPAELNSRCLDSHVDQVWDDLKVPLEHREEPHDDSNPGGPQGLRQFQDFRSGSIVFLSVNELKL